VPRSGPDEARRALGRRAITALGLLVGFYLLAFGIVAAIVVLLVAALRGGHFRINMIPLAVAALAILRGVFYLDRAKDELPPVRIEASRDTQPVLWTEVDAMAEALGAPRPDTILLVHDVNAFVYQESRMLGLRKGRTVLGIGMPLLAVLRAAELRAVLAHEFGHISGGDTRFGPVVYRVRESLLRVVKNLGDGLLGKAFAGYFRLFMRLTMEVSRAQELAADAGAVRLVGRAATGTALHHIAIVDAAFDLLIGEYAVPVLRQGRWPADLYGGLRALCAEPGRGDQLRAAGAELMEQPTGKWDSHPSLGERVRRVTGMPEGHVVDDQRPARGMLRDADRIEQELAAQIAAAMVGQAANRDARGEPAIQQMSWEDAAREVLGPALEGAARRFTSAAIALGGDWRRRGLDQALELLDAGRGEELALQLVPDLAEQPADERPRIVDRALRRYFHAAIANELVRRHGWQWVSSWSELATAGGRSGTAPRRLARAALSGPAGVAAVRQELGLWATAPEQVPAWQVQ
jgi:Zn-dependent protease with chaperone function